MNQGKEKQRVLRKSMVTVVLLLVCMLLVIGTTWARYYAKDTKEFDYVARVPDAVSIWATYDGDGSLAGTPAWRFEDGSGTLTAYISNGTSTDCAEEDMQVSIRLLSSLSITNAEVTLSIEGETECWTAVPVQITTGTALYQTFGAGTVFVFQDKDGTELSWELEGETLSVLPVSVEVENLNQTGDAALLKVQIVGK